MFAYYSVLAVSFLLFFYALKIFKKPFHQIAEHSLAVVDGLISKLEESIKVALVQARMTKLLKGIFLGLLALIVAALIGCVPSYVYLRWNELPLDVLDFSSGYAILAISIGSTLGFMLPVKWRTKSDYSELSKLLHRMVLNHYNICLKLFNRERKKKKHLAKPNDKFVIVSGLARAGTTSLMNALYESGRFSSLSYASMPFLTCPNTWSKIYKPKSGKTKERSHKDGIEIGMQSNEALEEYFFKMLAQDNYIDESSVHEYALTQKEYNDYLDYQRLIRQSDDAIYLAKNNNFITRYKSVRGFNEDFVFVVLFRDPISHASSLLEKHKYYSELQHKDPFVLEYMDWLGHHEFGVNHKPFLFDKSDVEFNANKSSLDYWLQVWMNYYTYVLSLEKDKVLLVNYLDYCSNPEGLLNNIMNELELPKLDYEVPPYKNTRVVETECSEELINKANALFSQLKNYTA